MTATDETAQGETLSADEAALGWFVLLRDDEATDEDHRRFAQWLAADAAHQDAWAAAGQLWQGLGQLSPRAAQPRVVVPCVVLPDATQSGAAILASPPVPRRRAGVTMLVAATLAALAMGIGWQLVPVGVWADYRAGVGERRQLQLADGSAVELATASALDVNFTADRREVRLLTGEAFFTITADPDRPFVVQAGDGEVVVRGTAFNVRIDDGVQVSVTQHSVDVSAGGGLPVHVTEGEAVHFDAAGVSAVTLANLDNVQAWRQDQLVFVDAALDDVIAELGRYRHGYVRLIGGDLGQRRVTAVFDSRRPDEALETIARSLGLRVYRATGLVIGLAAG